MVVAAEEIDGGHGHGARSGAATQAQRAVDVEQEELHQDQNPNFFARFSASLPVAGSSVNDPGRTGRRKLLVHRQRQRREMTPLGNRADRRGDAADVLARQRRRGMLEHQQRGIERQRAGQPDVDRVTRIEIAGRCDPRSPHRGRPRAPSADRLLAHLGRRRLDVERKRHGEILHDAERLRETTARSLTMPKRSRVLSQSLLSAMSAVERPKTHDRP